MEPCISVPGAQGAWKERREEGERSRASYLLPDAASGALSPLREKGIERQPLGTGLLPTPTEHTSFGKRGRKGVLVKTFQEALGVL